MKLKLSSALSAADLVTLNSVEVERIKFKEQTEDKPASVGMMLANCETVRVDDQLIEYDSEEGKAVVHVFDVIAARGSEGGYPVTLEFRKYRPLTQDDVLNWEESNPELVSKFL